MLQGIGGWGLDFAMVAAFIGMVIPYLKDKPTYIAVLAAAISALVFQGMPHKLGLIMAAVIGMAAGVTAEMLQERRAHARSSRGD
jgi:predicted branched-subunit amino acid permease